MGFSYNQAHSSVGFTERSPISMGMKKTILNHYLNLKIRKQQWSESYDSVRNSITIITYHKINSHIHINICKYTYRIYHNCIITCNHTKSYFTSTSNWNMHTQTASHLGVMCHCPQCDNMQLHWALRTTIPRMQTYTCLCVTCRRS